METATNTQTQWQVDAMHSEVQFKVRHLVISNVTGTFKAIGGTITTDAEDFNGANLAFTADAASIDTNVSDRDNHLRSPDFFDAEQYPELKLTGQLKKEKDQYTLVGELTIKDVTKSIELATDFGGTMVDGYGQTKAGFEFSGKINRKDYGLTWNQVTEAGGVVVGDEVKLHFNVQVTKA